jgi:hypothetical protein
MTEGKENNKQIKEQAQAKKNAPKVRFLTGGVDGTRTRDPRRDRPVF